MDLKAVSQKAVDSAFAAAASLLKECVYHSLVQGAYVPDAGTSPVTDTTTTIKILSGVFTQKEVDGERVRSGDEKRYIKRIELVTEPKADDYLIDPDGKRWDVTMLMSEPTEKLWIIGVRGHKV